MFKLIRILYISLMILLSVIYWYECKKDRQKFSFLQGSESYVLRTTDPSIKEERLHDHDLMAVLVYLSFFVPANLLLLWVNKKPSKVSKGVFITATGLALITLLFYLFRIK